MAFDNIKLEKGMYGQTGASFSQVLEGLDPSEAYKGTEMEGLDAFQRQLKRFGIKARGEGSDVVAKFFATTDSSVLFPEYVSRTVRQGMEEQDILKDIAASVTKIDSMDYRSITSVPTEDEKSLMKVGEGAALPQTEVRTQSNLVKLHKRGRMLVASYEAIKFQKLDLFSVTLRQIGNYIMRQHLNDAVEVIVNGDGNGNPAEKLTGGSGPISASATGLSYEQLCQFWAQLDPYEMNTLLAPGDMVLKMLKMEELQNPLTGLNFQGTGKLTTPLGAKLIRTSAVAPGQIIGLDKNYALEMVQAGDLAIEYDKLIDRQLERAAITSITGFAKIYKDAAKVMEA